MPQQAAIEGLAIKLSREITGAVTSGEPLSTACYSAVSKLVRESSKADRGPTMASDVRHFMEACDQQVHSPGDERPKGGQPTADLRRRLIIEETDETLEALALGDVVGLAGELVDTVYVAIGTAHAYGIDFDQAWGIVHSANMAKVDSRTGKAIVDKGGKVSKPEGWVRPDLSVLFPFSHDHQRATGAPAPSLSPPLANGDKNENCNQG